MSKKRTFEMAVKLANWHGEIPLRHGWILYAYYGLEIGRKGSPSIYRPTEKDFNEIMAGKRKNG